MKNYRITVNGNTYDVQVEELGAAAQSAPVQSAASAPSAQNVPVQSAAPAPSAQSAEGTPVNAPMPGNILDIKVNVGDSVTAEQVVVVLEAMKMENDIVTPVSGKVTAINVSKGQAVNSGDVLITVAD